MMMMIELIIKKIERIMATNDSQLAWSIKNGDLDTVKEIIEHIGVKLIDFMK